MAFAPVLEGRPHLLIFEATIPEASQPMESNRARQAVAGFSFVEFAGDELAERRVLEPSQWRHDTKVVNLSDF